MKEKELGPFGDLSTSNPGSEVPGVALEAPNVSARRADDIDMGDEVAQRSVSDAEFVDGDEVREPRRRNSPSDPTSKEIEDHVLTGHASFRSWCAACVQERGRAERHQGDGRKELEDGLKVLVVSWDYCFLGAKNRASEVEVEQRGDSPVLVMHDSVTKSIFAHLIPAKGVDFPCCEKVVKMIVNDLDTLGYRKVVFRCDNEPAILSLLRAVKLAWSGDVLQETSAEGDPQSNGAAESSVNVVKGHVRSVKLAVESTCGEEVPAVHGLFTWLVSYATRVHRRFSVGRDGKTAYERTVGRRAVPPLAQFGERVWWMPLQPSNRRLGPLDSRFEQGRYLGPTDGSNTVLVGTESGVVKARTIKRMPPGERWTGSLLNEAQGSELTPNALDDDGDRVGIRAPVLQPHAAIPLPPLVPEFRQVRRAQLRKTDFEQFGYTDNSPGCANARAGRKQAVDHSEQCRVRVERILETTTEGHERLERARDRFAQAAKEPGVDEPQRKRHRPVGEGGQPLAPPVSHTYQEGGSSGSGALPPPPPPVSPSVPPSLESSLAK